ncbi:hypothetical protein P3L10_003841 [Capsicum annuum]
MRSFIPDMEKPESKASSSTPHPIQRGDPSDVNGGSLSAMNKEFLAMPLNQCQGPSNVKNLHGNSLIPSATE